MWSQGVGFSAQANGFFKNSYICVLIVCLFVGYRKKIERKKHYFDFKKYCILGALSLKVLEENKFVLLVWALIF